MVGSLNCSLNCSVNCSFLDFEFLLNKKIVKKSTKNYRKSIAISRELNIFWYRPSQRFCSSRRLPQPSRPARVLPRIPSGQHGQLVHENLLCQIRDWRNQSRNPANTSDAGAAVRERSQRFGAWRHPVSGDKASSSWEWPGCDAGASVQFCLGFSRPCFWTKIPEM